MRYDIPIRMRKGEGKITAPNFMIESAMHRSHFRESSSSERTTAVDVSGSWAISSHPTQQKKYLQEERKGNPQKQTGGKCVPKKSEESSQLHSLNYSSSSPQLCSTVRTVPTSHSIWKLESADCAVTLAQSINRRNSRPFKCWTIMQARLFLFF